MRIQRSLTVLRSCVSRRATRRSTVAINPCGWAWANSAMLPLFIGGRIDPGSGSDHYAQRARRVPPVHPWQRRHPGWWTHVHRVRFVGRFEPEDRNPVSFVTQLGSLSLKAAQVATLPPRRPSSSARSPHPKRPRAWPMSRTLNIQLRSAMGLLAPVCRSAMSLRWSAWTRTP